MNDDIALIIDRFENTLQNNRHQYFDVEEFVEIIEYYLDNYDLNNVLNAIKYAYSQHPDAYDIQKKEAEIFVLTNKADKALKILNILGTINYDTEFLKASAYLLKSNSNLYKKHIQFCLNESREQSFDSIYKIAISYLSLNKWHDIAIKFLFESYNINNHNAFVLNDIAITYERIKNHKKAIIYYKKYIDLDPFDETAWFNLASVYENELNYKKAIESYEFSITINQRYQPAYLNIASIYIDNDEFIKAINIYKEFLNFSEHKHEVYCLMGECYERNANYDEAYSCYTKALKINEKFADAWFGLSMVKYETKEFFESLYFIKRGLLLDEDNEEYHFELGNINYKLEFYTDAIKSYKRAISINPIDIEFSYTLSDLYYKLNDIDAAMEVLLKSEQYIIDSAEIKFRLAFYYAFINNTIESKSYFEQALKLDNSIFAEILENFSDIQISKSIKDFIKKQNNNE